MHDDFFLYKFSRLIFLIDAVLFWSRDLEVFLDAEGMWEAED